MNMNDFNYEWIFHLHDTPEELEEWAKELEERNKIRSRRILRFYTIIILLAVLIVLSYYLRF